MYYLGWKWGWHQDWKKTIIVFILNTKWPLGDKWLLRCDQNNSKKYKSYKIPYFVIQYSSVHISVIVYHKWDTRYFPYIWKPIFIYFSITKDVEQIRLHTFVRIFWATLYIGLFWVGGVWAKMRLLLLLRWGSEKKYWHYIMFYLLLENKQQHNKEAWNLKGRLKWTSIDPPAGISWFLICLYK